MIGAAVRTSLRDDGPPHIRSSAQRHVTHSRYEVTANWYIEDSAKDQQKAAKIASSFLRSAVEPDESQGIVTNSAAASSAARILYPIVTNSVTIGQVESASA